MKNKYFESDVPTPILFEMQRRKGEKFDALRRGSIALMIIRGRTILNYCRDFRGL
jgi:hypothetical protein